MPDSEASKDAADQPSRSLHDSHERFERIARTIPCVLYDFTVAEGTARFLYLSARFEEFFEIKPEEVIERPNRFWRLLHPEDLVRMQREQSITTTSRDQYNAEVRVITPSGRTRWISFSALPNPGHAGATPVWSGFMFDITERKAMEEEIRRLAVTDSLTGIANRMHFLQHLAGELERFRRGGSIASVLMLDLDRFKLVNDSYGHAAGDAVLKEFVALAAANLRQQDFFGRLGGEEFAILLPGTRLVGAMELAARLCHITGTSPVAVDARQIRYTVSIGVTEFQADEVGAESVLARADAALYRAKLRGRNRVVVF